MMTDEKLIELLRKIKEHCRKCDDCSICQLYFEEPNDVGDISTNCQIKLLALLLSDTTPNNWDMEEIERIIRL